MSINRKLIDRICRLQLEHIAPLLLLVLAYVSYSNTFTSPFVFDDNHTVKYNGENGLLFPRTVSVRYLVDFTFRLNYLIDGLNPAGFHAVNIAIHAAAGVFLYYAVYYALFLPVLKEMAGRAGRISLALAVAAIWVVHPLNTESVTYVCQRYESLMGMFFLLTVFLFIKGSVSTNHRAWYGMSLVSSLLTMATKEVAVTLPFFLLLMDYILVSKSFREMLSVRWKLHVAYLLTLFVLIILFSYWATWQALHGVVPFTELSRWQYLCTQSQVITHYLKLCFWPVGQCIDYNWAAVTSISEYWRHGLFLGGLLGVGVVGLAAKRPYSLPVIGFFLILAPTSSIMALGDMAFEHRMYLPLAPVTVLAVFILWKAITLLVRYNRIGLLLFCAIIAAIVSVLSSMTYERNKVYSSEASLWENVLEVVPKNVRAMNNLTLYYINDKEFAKAGHWACKAIDTIREYRSSNKSGYTRLTMSDASLATALDRLSTVQMCTERIPYAITNLASAVMLAPNDVVIRQNYAVALYLGGLPVESEKQIRLVLIQSPFQVPALAFYGYMLADQGRYVEAVKQYQMALVCDKHNLAVNLELALIEAACPDKSLRDHASALERVMLVIRGIGTPSVKALDAAGIAFAANGDFAQAEIYAGKALAMVRERHELVLGGESGLLDGIVSNEETISELESRLGLYRQRKPFFMAVKKPQ